MRRPPHSRYADGDRALTKARHCAPAGGRMSLRRVLFVCVLLTMTARVADAQVFGTVRVMARDPQSLALPGTSITIKSRTSTRSQAVTTDESGEAIFAVV